MRQLHIVPQPVLYLYRSAGQFPGLVPSMPFAVAAAPAAAPAALAFAVSSGAQPHSVSGTNTCRHWRRWTHLPLLDRNLLGDVGKPHRMVDETR